MLLPLVLQASVVLLIGLVIERARVDRSHRAIPLRIAVTGTRGKTSVVRLLASVLREDGRRVLAKTTGSKATLILPDGSVEEIRRRGQPSILEQKELLYRGVALGVDVVVAEIMSIHAENHLAETHHILKPHTVLVTNFRVDHTGAVGETREDVAVVLALDVPKGSSVFVPEAECLSAFRESAEESGAALTEVPSGMAAKVIEEGEGTGPAEFGGNLDLVVASARSLGVDDEAIRRGIRGALQDIGAVRIWQYKGERSTSPTYLVSAFAANDPESTMLVYDRVMETLGTSQDRCVGLMNLRADRGDRSLQWADALAGGLLTRFSSLYATGLHAPALRRRVSRLGGGDTPSVRVLRSGPAPDLTESVLSGIRDTGGVVFGFGNIGGVGEELVEHWDGVGEVVGDGV
jgi:poly-gamma-glutamate synthase PgsB/CapB